MFIAFSAIVSNEKGKEGAVNFLLLRNIAVAFIYLGCIIYFLFKTKLYSDYAKIKVIND